MSKEVWIGIVITAGIVGGFAYWQYGAFWRSQPPAPPPSPAAVAPAGPQIQYPVPAAPAPEPLPLLAESDDTIRRALSLLFGQAAIESWLVPQKIISSTVATIDSLDRDPVPLHTRAIAQVPKVLAVDSRNGALTLSPRNTARYQPLVALLQKADAAVIAQLYLRNYPLFQQAYRELGYPNGYFNDRLVLVIDHMLAAPELKLPIALARPKVLYEFADPDLEHRSWGQKTLIRMGPDNAKVIKAKLREIREIVAARKA